MTETRDISDDLERLRWPLRLTYAGLWAERIARAFWPLWTTLALTLAALLLGVQDFLPLEAVWTGLGLALLLALGTGFVGARRFRRPTPREAVDRLDAAMPGNPLAALRDRQAIGTDDPASAAVWRAHRLRMADRLKDARAVRPDPALAPRDPFALRYVALTALAVALVFGSVWRVASVADMAPGRAEAMVGGPSWEGWVQPPGYTGKPALYLNDITLPDLEVPQGSQVQLRLYGEVGALAVAEGVSGRALPPDHDATAPAQDFQITQSGRLAIDGPGGREWQVVALADRGPKVTASGEVSREAEGMMKLPFTAQDDYGVTGGRAVITLDLAAVDRRFGLQIAPEPREAVTLDLPLPITGNRAEFSENLIEDLSEHPFANLPVQIRLLVDDAAGQTGESAALSVVLPGKRFFDPLAAALIEMRRDLLWNRENIDRSVQILKAVTNRPEDLIRNERAFLRLKVLMRRMEAEAAALTPEMRDEFAAQLWEIALMVEEGDLESARQRLQRAQDRLDEAIRNGADPSEIEELMQELREALNDYMQELAEEAQRNPDREMSQNLEGMEMTGDQLQQMLDELQKLMEEGRMAEAAELMEMLRQLMENMQVTEGQGGQGGPGSQAMRDLQDTLRDQQGLSDDSFQELQEQFNGQQGQNQQGQQGQGNQQGQNQPGGPQQGDQQGQGSDGRSLAERQRDLRNQLRGVNPDALPGQGSDAGERGRDALDRAGRAMEDAERALRDGDLSGALDRQAEAMEALREGLRDFGEAMAEERQQQGQADQGEAFGRADPNSQRDPLGRELGEMGRIGSDRNMLQGEDVYRRAQDLLDEIRRRSGEQARPESERDYLRRLLDLF
ncbi:TIGR02302 family protein [Aliigemmobacter aestuarii]|uniref:TIGR02302 family protein n=1 Tax=Aliigemmobacter aestuarii TaxID=1445661 RepID=A0A4S3MMC5_9RHOB|nr:TIGR02302 family protein [Gemmobacter aestuarii]THD83570.1 TIGR02302 family protein [Gemmobacter aestuarii]